MTPARLRECLAILDMGPKELGRKLQQVRINERTVRHWAAGTRDMPPRIAAWLEECVRITQEHPLPEPPEDWRE